MEGSPLTVNITKGIRLARQMRKGNAVRDSRYPKTSQGCPSVAATLVRHDPQFEGRYVRELDGVVLGLPHGTSRAKIPLLPYDFVNRRFQAS